jgi:hypothetical protein
MSVWPPDTVWIQREAGGANPSYLYVDAARADMRRCLPFVPQSALADRDRRIDALTKALREARAAVFEESAHIAETCYEERCCNEPVPRCCGRGRNGECCGDPEPECCGQPERIPYSPDDIAKALRDAKEAALASAAGAEGEA